MKKILLLSLACCVALCLFVVSCSKTVKIAISYSVTDSLDNNFSTAYYIPDSGTYAFPVRVKFLSGYTADSVSLTFTGLPADVRVTPSSFIGIPTYTEDFVFYTNHAVHGTYPITLISYSPTTGYDSFHFNLGVIAADCPAPFIGTLNGSNSCGHHYTATGTDTVAYKNILYVHGFGGYGSNVTVPISLNCGTDSAYIAQGNYGNSVILSGQGIFTGNTIIIHYVATSTPFGAETCTDTLTIN